MCWQTEQPTVLAPASSMVRMAERVARFAIETRSSRFVASSRPSSLQALDVSTSTATDSWRSRMAHSSTGGVAGVASPSDDRHKIVLTLFNSIST